MTGRPARSAERWLDLSIAALLGGGALAVYVRTLAPGVLAGDGGEFQFVPYLLGVAHPTGYPLYLLLGWAWSHLLPVGDVAYRMNLFSAAVSALAVAWVYPTARALLRQAFPAGRLPPAAQRLVAALAAALFAVTPTFWSQSVIAEVYPLHILLLVVLLYLLLRWGEARQERFLLLAAGCFGLGLAHHRTTLLLVPGVLAYVWLTDRRSLGNGRLLLKAAALALLPLVLYLTIPWRAPHTPYLHLPLAGGRELTLYENTVPGFVKFVLGGPFGGSVDLSVDLGARLAMAGGFLRADLGWIGLALAGAGVVALAARRRWAVLALTGLSFAAVVGFDLVYLIGDVFVLFIPAYLFAVLWSAAAVGAVASWLDRLDRGKRHVVSALAVLPFFALPVWTAAAHAPQVTQSGNTGAEAFWQAVLAEPLPAGAALVSNDRNDIMPLWYYQYVGDGRPQRPDLLGLFPLITPDYPTLGAVLDLALGTGRPVYLIKEMAGIEVKVEVVPEGKLWRVLGPAVQGEPAYHQGQDLGGAVALVGHDRSPPAPRAGEPWGVSLTWEVLQPMAAEYHTYVQLLDAQGGKIAQSDRQPGGVYYPTTLWQPGERLRDDHVLEIPADATAGPYRLVAGMYALKEDGTIESLGEPITLVEVEVESFPVRLK